MKKNNKCALLVLAASLIVGLSTGVQSQKALAEEFNNVTEVKYIVECHDKNQYEEVANEFGVFDGEDMLAENNIQIVSNLRKNEIKKLNQEGAIVEEDVSVTGSYVLNKGISSKNSSVKNSLLTKKEYNWNVRSIGVDNTIDSNAEGEKVKVAILDSGIDYTESINVVERKNFIDDEVSPLYEDNTGHGTAIAGIIASNGENDTIKGINPNVEIYSARILDTDNMAPISRVVESIYWAIEKDVDIINISFGTNVESEILHNAIKEATKKGILVFAASGNQGEGSKVEYPAAYKEVVAVGATNPAGEVAEMTSKGKELDILAPGVNIQSIGWLDMEVTCSGTSMAVPHAVGAASLLWQMDLNKSADFIKGLLEISSKSVIDDGKEYYYIDVNYANEIYDEYSKKYNSGIKEEVLEETYNNPAKVETYDESVTGSWSKKNHEAAVEYAYSIAGGLTSTELKVLKLGSRAPDDYCAADKVPTHRMFHAKDNYNYVKVYEYIMDMAIKCKKSGHSEALNIGYPNNDAGFYGECATVKSWMGKAEIEVMLTDKNKYNKKNTSLIMLGIAMHVVGDTYAHQFGVYTNGVWKDAPGVNDDTTNCSSRWACTKEQYREMLELWNEQSKADFLNFIQDYKGFRLKNLSYFSEISPGNLKFEPYRTIMDMHSY